MNIDELIKHLEELREEHGGELDIAMPRNAGKTPGRNSMYRVSALTEDQFIYNVQTNNKREK